MSTKQMTKVVAALIRIGDTATQERNQSLIGLINFR
jgi:hypothetical protein